MPRPGAPGASSRALSRSAAAAINREEAWQKELADEEATKKREKAAAEAAQETAKEALRLKKQNLFSALSSISELQEELTVEEQQQLAKLLPATFSGPVSAPASSSASRASSPAGSEWAMVGPGDTEPRWARKKAEPEAEAAPEAALAQKPDSSFQ